MKIDFKSQKVAKSVMALMIVVSAILGNGNSLGREKQEVEDYFFYGDQGICIANDLNDMASEVENLVVIASKYDVDQNVINKAKDSAIELKNSKNVSEKYELTQALNSYMKSLYNEVEEADLSDNHRKLAKGAYVDYNSTLNIITHDPYNEMANEYNSLLDTFPSSLFRIIHRADEAELFQ